MSFKSRLHNFKTQQSFAYKAISAYLVLFVILTVALAGASLFAPKTYTIAGYVYGDSNKNGMKDSFELGRARAEVILTPKEGKPTRVTSNVNGYFVFKTETPGEFTVSFVPTSDVTSNEPVMVVLNDESPSKQLGFGTKSINTGTASNVGIQSQEGGDSCTAAGKEVDRICYFSDGVNYVMSLITDGECGTYARVIQTCSSNQYCNDYTNKCESTGSTKPPTVACDAPPVGTVVGSVCSGTVLLNEISTGCTPGSSTWSVRYERVKDCAQEGAICQPGNVTASCVKTGGPLPQEDTSTGSEAKPAKPKPDSNAKPACQSGTIPAYNNDNVCCPKNTPYAIGGLCYQTPSGGGSSSGSSQPESGTGPATQCSPGWQLLTAANGATTCCPGPSTSYGNHGYACVNNPLPNPSDLQDPANYTCSQTACDQQSGSGQSEACGSTTCNSGTEVCWANTDGSGTFCVGKNQANGVQCRHDTSMCQSGNCAVIIGQESSNVGICCPAGQSWDPNSGCVEKQGQPQQGQQQQTNNGEKCGDSVCSSNQFCYDFGTEFGQQCLDPQANGIVCSMNKSAATQCASGYCNDGVCGDKPSGQSNQNQGSGQNESSQNQQQTVACQNPQCTWNFYSPCTCSNGVSCSQEAITYCKGFIPQPDETGQIAACGFSQASCEASCASYGQVCNFSSCGCALRGNDTPPPADQNIGNNPPDSQGNSESNQPEETKDEACKRIYGQSYYFDGTNCVDSTPPQPEHDPSQACSDYYGPGYYFDGEYCQPPDASGNF